MGDSVSRRPMGYLRKMLARSRAFQEWAGVTTWGDAAGRIHYETKAASSTRPFAVIRYGPRGHTPIAGGTRQFSVPWGTLSVVLEQEVASGDLDSNRDVSDEGAVTTAMHEHADTIAAEVAEMAGTTDAIAHFRRVELVDGPAISDADEGDPYVQAVVEFEYGLTG